jgi:lipoyl(octanoyl) transferase
MADLLVCHLGLVPYDEALELQHALREARVRDEIDDVLLLLEHPPVVTRGRRSDPSELGLGEAFLRAQGVDVITTQRGGLATYHGPGMLVGYPIVRTPDVHEYLRTLERALVATLAEEGISAHQRPSTPEENLTGVWVGGPDELEGDGPPLRTDGSPTPHAGVHRKIASLGVHMSRGVAAHGFAVGADNDLTPWDWFTPCGLPTARMTSVGAETARAKTLPCLRKRAANHVARELGLRQRLVSRARLEAAAGLTPETRRPTTA